MNVDWTLMTAEDRARQLMLSKVNEVPDKAKEIRQEYCEKYAFCGEVLLHAYLHYAREVEGLYSDGSFGDL